MELSLFLARPNFFSAQRRGREPGCMDLRNSCVSSRVPLRVIVDLLTVVESRILLWCVWSGAVVVLVLCCCLSIPSSYK